MTELVQRFFAHAAAMLGAGGAAFAGVVPLCCFGFTGVATFVTAIGLGFLVRLDTAVPLLYAVLAVQGLGLALNWRQHRRALALLIWLIGAAMIWYPYEGGVALEVDLFLALVYGGIILLVAAALVDFRLTRLCARSC